MKEMDVGGLLFADVAVELGAISGAQAAAALQQYWDSRNEDLQALVGAQLDEESRKRVTAEVERRLSEAGGDPRSALLRRGVARSVHVHLSADQSLSLAREAGSARAPLRTLDPERYIGFTPLGEGSMGSVYLAVDTELNRRVAFKMIRTGAHDPLDATPRQAGDEMVVRFLQEAWVTGGLEHPGIVPVYEVGRTPSGVPYYTMRLVRGDRTLEDAIAAAESFEDRLQLLDPFLRVCDATRYAHSRGVVHRDLKPANVALGQFGETMVLDWGLAKLGPHHDLVESRWQSRMDELRTETNLQTLTGALGTPGYMAPEAALGQVKEIDERSDVYSLGAILYRILEGRVPHRFDSFTEFVEKLTGEQPEPPQGPAGLAAICLKSLSRDKRDRHKDAGELAAAVRIWQTQSALDREVQGLVQEARSTLDSAAVLSDDALLRQVERVTSLTARALDLRPTDEDARALRESARGFRDRAIESRERSARKRLLKRVAVVGLAVATVTVVLVAVVLNDKRREAEAARVSEREARQRAQDERVRAEELAGFMLFDLRDGLGPIGRLDLLGKVAHRSLEYYESLPLEGLTAQETRARGVALSNVGDVLHAMGDLTKALASFRESLKVRRRLVAQDPNNALWQRDLKFILDRIGDVHVDSGKYEEAFSIYRKSLAVARVMEARDPADAEWQCYLAWSFDRIGDVQRRTNDLARARASYADSLIVRRRLLTADPSNELWELDLCSTLDRLGAVQRQVGDTEGALSSCRETLQIRRRRLLKEPTNAALLRQLALSLSSQGSALRAAGNLTGARSSIEECLELRKRLATKDPENAVLRSDLALTYREAGELQQEMGDVKRALESFRESLKISKRLLEGDRTNALWHRRVAMALDSVGRALEAGDDLNGAARTWGEAVEAHRRAVELSPRLADEHRLFESQLRRVLLLSGEREPEGAADHLVLANAFYDRKDFVRSAQSYAITLRDDSVRRDLDRFNLYNAACSAALASARLEGDEATKWRLRAIDWLAEDFRRRLDLLAGLDQELKGELAPAREAKLRRIQKAQQAHFEHARVSDTDLKSLRGMKQFEELLGQLVR